MAISTLSGSYIDETYHRLVQVSGSEFADGDGNPISFGAGTLSGGIDGYIPVWSGSTSLSNSVISQTGNSLNISGTINVQNGITASLEGTASWAYNVVNIPTIDTGSFVTNSQTSSMSVRNAETASYINPLFISASANDAGFAAVNPTISHIPYNISGAFSDSFLTQNAGILRTTSSYGNGYSGIYLDLDTNGYFFGNIIGVSSNTANGIAIANGISYFNAANGSTNILQFELNSTSNIIRTNNGLGLKLDFDTNSYGLGNFNDGSIIVTGSQVQISGSFEIEETKTVFKKVIIENIGLTELVTNDTGSFSAAIGKYTINSGSNTRAGEFITAWNGSQIVTTDTSTTDIGNTKNVSFTSSISAEHIIISVNAQSTGWNIKMLTTYI